MKQILIYPIKSLMRHDNYVDHDSKQLLDDLSILLGSNYQFKIIDNFDSIKDELVLILVQSGGSEGYFKKDIYPKFNGPYYLLTYGSCNSLAASLEILSFLKQHNKKGEVLHGDNDYIVERIKSLSDIKTSDNIRLGVFGTPSDWLISSDVDYKKCEEIFNISLIDVDQDEIVKEIESFDIDQIKVNEEFDYDKLELKKALRIYQALKNIVVRYNLQGFTLRCFDIIAKVHTSACLALAMLNKEGIIAGCEGDIPAMILAYLIKKALNVNSFQANPQWINPKDNTIEFAHCTLPLDMCETYNFDTHFESGIGVGIHGILKEGPITIFKISADLNEFYCETGMLTNNDYRKDRCRTQIKIKLDAPVLYFLNSSLGNHHQIIYGNHQDELINFMINMGLRNIK